MRSSIVRVLEVVTDEQAGVRTIKTRAWFEDSADRPETMLNCTIHVPLGQIVVPMESIIPVNWDLSNRSEEYIHLFFQTHLAVQRLLLALELHGMANTFEEMVAEIERLGPPG